MTDAAELRIGYLGPEGTFTHEAALAGAAGESPASPPAVEVEVEAKLVGLATIYDVVMAVARGDVDRAIVPIENSIEGSVSATLDTLAMDAETVHIVGEQIHRIEQCLIAAAPLALADIDTVMSHPQASGSVCALSP